jgi:ribosomal-protein-alanine N-acetyltransferase
VKEFLIGNRISLHGLRSEDLAEGSPYYRWLNDLSMDTFTERSRLPRNAEQLRDYFDKTAHGDDLVLLGIYDNETGRHVGNVSFKQINWQSRRGFLGYIIGEPDFQGKGIASEAVSMFMYYGFNKLNFARILTTVTSENAASRRVCEKCGFVEEGCMRRHILTGDRAWDVVMFGALRDEWMAGHADAARALYENPPF